MKTESLYQKMSCVVSWAKSFFFLLLPHPSFPPQKRRVKVLAQCLTKIVAWCVLDKVTNYHGLHAAMDLSVTCCIAVLSTEQKRVQQLPLDPHPNTLMLLLLRCHQSVIVAC